MINRDLTKRMQRLKEFQVSDHGRQRHLGAIEQALELAPAVDASTRRWSTRRRIAGAVLAASMLGPAGVAFAAQSALPGDALYPTKRAIEQVQVVLDPAVVARHRLDELSALVERADVSSAVSVAFAEAENAMSLLPADSELHAQWATLRAQIEESDASDSAVSGDEPSPGPESQTGSATEPQESALETPEPSVGEAERSEEPTASVGEPESSSSTSVDSSSEHPEEPESPEEPDQSEEPDEPEQP